LDFLQLQTVSHSFIGLSVFSRIDGERVSGAVRVTGKSPLADERE
jgi:hypothetical protein